MGRSNKSNQFDKLSCNVLVETLIHEPVHEKTNILVPTRSNTNRRVQSQKHALSLKFRI